MTAEPANITPEQATHLLQSEAAAESAAPAQPDAIASEDAAKERPPLTPPETIAPEAIVPAPAPELPTPIQAAGEGAPSTEAKSENLVILPAVAKKAEANLAAHIGAHIDPALEEKLMLTVLNAPDKQASNLVLSFEGEMVASNASLLGEQVIAALHKVPALEGVIKEQHVPHARLHDGKLEVTIPHLTTAQYAHVIQAIAAGIPTKDQDMDTSAPAPVETPAGPDHPCSGAGCSHCNAHSAEAAVAEAQPAPDAVAADVALPEAAAAPDTAQPAAQTAQMHPAAEAAEAAQASAAQAVANTAPAPHVAAVDHQGVANDNLPERQVG